MGFDKPDTDGVRLTDALTDILRRRQLVGEQTVLLPGSVRKAFFRPVTRGGGAPSPERAERRQGESDSQPGCVSRRGPASGGRDGQSAPPAAAGSRASSSSPAPGDAAPTPADLASLDLPALAEKVAHCRACPLHRSRTQTVFGDGSMDPRLMFIGEGPGADEDRQGIPFVGRAGQLLTRMIQAMQFRREDVYIANIVKCRPPGNRNPEAEEATTCLPYLQRQIELLAPEVIVLLGAVPLRYLLGQTGITRLHGTWLEYEGIAVMPTFHPAYLLRMESRKREAWEDLKKVMVRLGKDPEVTMRQTRQDR